MKRHCCLIWTSIRVRLLTFWRLRRVVPESGRTSDTWRRRGPGGRKGRRSGILARCQCRARGSRGRTATARGYLVRINIRSKKTVISEFMDRSGTRRKKDKNLLSEQALRHLGKGRERSRLPSARVVWPIVGQEIWNGDVGEALMLFVGWFHYHKVCSKIGLVPRCRIYVESPFDRAPTVDPKEIPLPHEFILNRDLLAQLYPSFAAGATPFFTLNWSKYGEFLTFRGGLDPVTGGKRNRGGRPSALGGRSSAPNGYPWTAVCTRWMAVCPKRQPLDGRLARVDDRLLPNGSI
ncbi:unnamed protein product [Sphenostylis stenocarpa]|uniref:Uncharacterized protein n=1 Tax=Sphenostylis stenocarpa TaxID=92480 RepID=A0AA86VN69_9FABA|nr:unnamed protein product [Sphenostylis stenocarpa]